MTRKIKALAACVGFMAAGAYLMNLAIKAAEHMLLLFLSI